mgnify:CR=1 FL=1
MGHHPGEQAIQSVPSGGQISPLVCMIIIAILAIIGYGIYWLFKKDKKKF